MLAALKRMPGPLAVALVGTTVTAALQLVAAVQYALHGNTRWFASDDSAFSTVVTGSWFAVLVLFTVGLARLTRRVSGTARLGVRIAWVGAALEVALLVAWLCVGVAEFARNGDGDPAWALRQIITPCVSLVFAIGLGIATRRWYWLLAGVCTTLLTSPPWFLADAVHDLLDQTPVQTWVVFHMVGLVSTLVTVALAIVAARDASPSTDAQQPTRGLAWISRALHGQAIAVGALVTFTILLDASPRSDAVPVYRVAIVLAIALELACLVALGLATLAAGRGRGPLPRWLLLASGTASLCIAGRTLLAGFDRAVRYFVTPGELRSIWFGTQDGKFVSSVSAEVLLACAICGVLISLAVAARKEGLEAVRARTMLRTGWFAALSAGAITGQLWISNLVSLTAVDLAILIATNVAFVASWLLAARAMRQGLDGGTILPTAKLIT